MFNLICHKINIKISCTYYNVKYFNLIHLIYLDINILFNLPSRSESRIFKGGGGVNLIQFEAPGRFNTQNTSPGYVQATS